MKTPKSLPLAAAMAAVMLWSSLGALGFARVAGLTPAGQRGFFPSRAAHVRADQDRAKLEAARQLGDLLSKPETIRDSDLRRVRRSFGADGSDLLRTLRRAEQGR